MNLEQKRIHDTESFARDRVSLVKLPERYKKALAGQEYLPGPDFVFIDTLLHRYNAIGNESTQPFGRNTFFSAVTDITNYATTLREKDIHDAATQDRETFELARPSNKRIADVSYLFLHIPRVKNIYNEIHAEKMEAAFPAFSETLPLATTKSETISEYFNHVTSSMKKTMVAVLDIFSPEEITNLGTIIGYNEHGYMRPPNVHKEDVGSIGVETFTSLLEEIVLDAKTNKINVATNVDSAFASSDGIAQRLMTISLREFVRLEDDHNLFFDEIEDIQTILDANTVYTGACPAIAKTEVAKNDTIIKHSVAYKYAHKIIGAIPNKLITAS